MRGPGLPEVGVNLQLHAPTPNALRAGTAGVDLRYHLHPFSEAFTLSFRAESYLHKDAGGLDLKQPDNFRASSQSLGGYAQVGLQYTKVFLQARAAALGSARDDVDGDLSTVGGLILVEDHLELRLQHTFAPASRTNTLLVQITAQL